MSAESDHRARPHTTRTHTHTAITAIFVTTLAGFTAPAIAQQAQAPAATSPSTAPPHVSESVVVTATLAPLPADNVASTVVVLTRDDLEGLGVRSLIEGLHLVPGVDPLSRGPRDVQTDFSIRGATFGQSLVLIDGLRLNDSQSGHHDGEIPTSIAGVDRIEIVEGGGSAIHGADALGGTINVITRRGSYRDASVEAGQFGYAAADGSIGGGFLPANWTLTGWGSRSSGFEFDREFAQGGVALRAAPARGWSIAASHDRRAFGANDFYGPSPSKEWTDGTLVSVGWSQTYGNWTASVTGLGRDHGDHFRWDINNPGFAENHHRTDAGEVDATIATSFRTNARLTFGTSGGGDWIRSSNLGDHDFSKASAFAELQWPLADRTTIESALRFDDYSNFGTSWSPSVGVATRLPHDFRVRASVGHAFRIPTFTELYYSDPANVGNPNLRAESGWSLDGGTDWTRGGWTVSVSPFRRRDSNVIDWVRATTDDLWQATNVRDVTTTGVEASLERRWHGALVRAYFAGLHVDAPSLTLLSKYVLEYARHQTGGSIAVPVGLDFRAALNVDHKHRVDGEDYTLVSAKVSRSFKSADAFVSGTNLLGATYHEVDGVDMPGRWITAGVEVR